MTETSEITSLEDLPPSAKLVYMALEHEEDGLTQRELATATGLHQRTTLYALDRLEEIEVLEKRPLIEDARQTVYSLTTEDTTR